MYRRSVKRYQIKQPTDYLKRQAIQRASNFALVRSMQARRTNWNTGKTREELKKYDIFYDSYPSNTTGTTTLINGIATGNSYNEREGRQCYWKTIQVTGMLKPTIEYTLKPSRNDLYVIYDKQPGAALPAMTDIFMESKGGSPLNLDYRDRFIVLAHKSWVVGYSDVTNHYAFGQNAYTVNIFKRINMKTTFKGDTNALTDISTGAIYLLTLGTESVTDNDFPSFYVTTRLRFSEK